FRGYGLNRLWKIQQQNMDSWLRQQKLLSHRPVTALSFSNRTLLTATLSFVIPSAAEGSAVLRTLRGKAELEIASFVMTKERVVVRTPLHRHPPGKPMALEQPEPGAN